MAYKELIDNISKRIDSLLEEISVEHNFELGSEFEIVLCKLLQRFLPNRYGVCRGYVVNELGDRNGDDIIIFDRVNFPMLRLIDGELLSQKQQIPVEAVFAYIEAKHSLYLTGQGGGSMKKAVDQVAAVKQMKRRLTEPPGINGLTSMEMMDKRESSGWPRHMNPMFGFIVARNVYIDDKKENDQDLIDATLFNRIPSLNEFPYSPDMMILGSNRIIIPAVRKEYLSPFFLPGLSELRLCKAPERAIGVGLCNFHYALDHMQLSGIDWPVVLAAALNSPYGPPLED